MGRSRDHDSLVTPLSHEPLMYYLRFKERKEGKGEELHRSIHISLFHFCVEDKNSTVASERKHKTGLSRKKVGEGTFMGSHSGEVRE